MSEVLTPSPDFGTIARLAPMLAMLESAPASLSSVTDPSRATDVHLHDSLSGLVVEELADCDRVADIGSGAGFPGIPLAVALPKVRFDLIESVGRKADFNRRVIEALGLSNVRAINARSEEWALGEGGERYAAATARAVAPLSVLAELASPLLRQDGVLIAWKGELEPAEEAAIAGLEPRLAMSADRIVAVRPFESSRIRHLYVIRKIGPTPSGIPRRPGMARKRPLTG